MVSVVSSGGVELRSSLMSKVYMYEIMYLINSFWVIILKIDSSRVGLLLDAIKFRLDTQMKSYRACLEIAAASSVKNGK